jgi:hypothetical protein
MLPDDYLRKLKQDLSEVEAQVESETHYVPDPDAHPPPTTTDTLIRPTRIPLTWPPRILESRRDRAEFNLGRRRVN